MMAWRGLQALSGGTLADMFPPMDRGMGMGMGGPGGQVGGLLASSPHQTVCRRDLTTSRWPWRKLLRHSRHRRT